MERVISDRILNERVSSKIANSYSPGLISVISKFPSINEHIKRQIVASFGDITEFHCDIIVETLANPEFITPIATIFQNQRIIQIVKAVEDDLYDIYFSVQGTTNVSKLSIDNFNSYANTTALRAIWIQSGPLLNVQLVTTGTYEGGKSMTLDFKNNIGQYVQRTYSTNQDWTSYYSFNFWHASSAFTTSSNMRIRIGDNVGNFMYYDIPVGIFLAWHQHIIPFALFTVETAQVNLGAITTIRFVVLTYGSASTEYFDLIELDPNVDANNYIETRIYNFGSTLPSTGTVIPTPMTFDDGSTFIKNFIKLVRNIIRVECSLGHPYSNNTPLTIGNYYGIEIKNPAAPSVIIYGSATNHPDWALYSVSAGALNTNLNKSIGVLSGSHVKGYLHSVRLEFNDTPGYRSRLIFVYKNIDTNIVISAPIVYSLNTEDTSLTFNFLEEGSEYYIDDTYFMLVYFQPNENTKASEISIHVKGCHKFGR